MNILKEFYMNIDVFVIDLCKINILEFIISLNITFFSPVY